MIKKMMEMRNLKKGGIAKKKKKFLICLEMVK